MTERTTRQTKSGVRSLEKKSTVIEHYLGKRVLHVDIVFIKSTQGRSNEGTKCVKLLSI